MLTLGTVEKSIRVPTFGLGIEWDTRAEKYLNLDFISLSIARQIAVERNARAEENLLAMLNGDADVGAASGIPWQGQDCCFSGRRCHNWDYPEGLDAVAV